MFQDSAEVQCPYCFEQVEVAIEPDVGGVMVQDCEVCCRPWQMHVGHDGDGNLIVSVSRAQ